MSILQSVIFDKEKDTIKLIISNYPEFGKDVTIANLVDYLEHLRNDVIFIPNSQLQRLTNLATLFLWAVEYDEKIPTTFFEKVNGGFKIDTVCQMIYPFIDASVIYVNGDVALTTEEMVKTVKHLDDDRSAKLSKGYYYTLKPVIVKEEEEPQEDPIANAVANTEEKKVVKEKQKPEEDPRKAQGEPIYAVLKLEGCLRAMGKALYITDDYCVIEVMDEDGVAKGIGSKDYKLISKKVYNSLDF